MSAVVKEEDFVEARIARLESDGAHIRSDVSEMKTDIRELKKIIGDLKCRVIGLRSEIQRLDIRLSGEIRNLDAKL
jgi:predicted RNase H-like nuclease (RuvC/YqgF family)